MADERVPSVEEALNALIRSLLCGIQSRISEKREANEASKPYQEALRAAIEREKREAVAPLLDAAKSLIRVWKDAPYQLAAHIRLLESRAAAADKEAT